MGDRARKYIGSKGGQTLDATEHEGVAGNSSSSNNRIEGKDRTCQAHGSQSLMGMTPDGVFAAERTQGEVSSDGTKGHGKDRAENQGREGDGVGGGGVQAMGRRNTGGVG